MIRCRVKSGDFELLVNSTSLLSAAQQAIRIHDLQRHSSDLGPMIVVCELDGDNIVDEIFIQTTSLTQTCVNGPYQEDGEKVKAILAELEEELERNGYYVD